MISCTIHGPPPQNDELPRVPVLGGAPGLGNGRAVGRGKAIARPPPGMFNIPSPGIMGVRSGIIGSLNSIKSTSFIAGRGAPF